MTMIPRPKDPRTAHGTFAALLMAAACSFASATDAFGQNPPAIEAWGAFSGVLNEPIGTLTSSYAPPLMNGTAISSSGGQVLSLTGSRGPGLQGGVNVFPWTHVGLQILVDRAKVDLSGANGPYSVALQWISLQPPDYVPRVFNTQSTTPWPDTTGSLSELTVGFNAVVRTDPTRRVWASVSGGPAWRRSSGTAQPLGYTEYHLGGHSVLFSEDVRLAFALEPANTLSFNAGGEVNVAIAQHAAIVVGYRYLGARTAELPVRPAAITNPDEVLFGTTVEEIAARMPVGPAQIDLSTSRFIVGLKVMR